MADTNNKEVKPNKQKLVYTGNHPMYKGELRLEVGGEYDLDVNDAKVKVLLKLGLLTSKK